MKHIALIIILFSIGLTSCSEDSMDVQESVANKTFLEKYSGDLYVNETGHGYEFTSNKETPIIYWEGCGNSTMTPEGKQWFFEEDSIIQRFSYDGHEYKRIYSISGNQLTRTQTKDGEVSEVWTYPKTNALDICNQ